jgi:hypothetical protein
LKSSADRRPKRRGQRFAAALQQKRQSAAVAAEQERQNAAAEPTDPLTPSVADVPTDAPTEAPTPDPARDPGPCDSAKLKGDRETSASLLSHRGSTEVLAALSDQMNDENACAESIENDDATKMRHVKEAGEAALYMAVYGPDMFGSKKSDLQLAQSFEQDVLDNSNTDDATRKEAQDIMDSASEKLSAAQ